MHFSRPHSQTCGAHSSPHSRGYRFHVLRELNQRKYTCLFPGNCPSRVSATWSALEPASTLLVKRC
jgi:hypothetical protein